MEHRDKLAKTLNRHFATGTAADWIDLIDSAGVPVGPILTLAEAFDDPQARHNQMLVEFDHPVAGLVRTTGSPIMVDGVPARTEAMPPLLGAHSRNLLIELGVDTDTVAKMIDDGRAIEP
jgi:crotonobetainyl-CoA:carnitine CoA-transferase CaiB-like acyl-CoA transferase